MARTEGLNLRLQLAEGLFERLLRHVPDLRIAHTKPSSVPSVTRIPIGSPGRTASTRSTRIPSRRETAANPRAIVAFGLSASSRRAIAPSPPRTPARTRSASRPRAPRAPSSRCRASRPRPATAPGRSLSPRFESRARWATTAPRIRASRSPRAVSTNPRTSATSGVTSSAAALGVAARTSATKSAIVTSTSWPTADTTGTGKRTMARATRSSLNAHRSSTDPPPRARIATSTRPARRSSALAIETGAPSPWTRHGLTRTSASGYRRPKTARTSCIAAPASDVTSPIRRGNVGRGRFRSAENSPSPWSRSRPCSNASLTAPCPIGRTCRATSWACPFAGNTSTSPRARTSIPSRSSNRRPAAAARNITHGTWAPASFRVKYAIPEAGRDTFPTSPRTITSVRAGWPPTMDRRARTSSDTESASRTPGLDRRLCTGSPMGREAGAPYIKPGWGDGRKCSREPAAELADLLPLPHDDRRQEDRDDEPRRREDDEAGVHRLRGGRVEDKVRGLRCAAGARDERRGDLVPAGGRGQGERVPVHEEVRDDRAEDVQAGGVRPVRNRDGRADVLQSNGRARHRMSLRVRDAPLEPIAGLDREVRDPDEVGELPRHIVQDRDVEPPRVRSREVQALRLAREGEELRGRENRGALREDDDEAPVLGRGRVHPDHVEEPVPGEGRVHAAGGRARGDRRGRPRAGGGEERVPPRRAAQGEVRVRGLRGDVREPDREAVRVAGVDPVDRGGAVPHPVREDRGANRVLEVAGEGREPRVAGPRRHVLREVVQVELVPAREAVLLVPLRGRPGLDHLGLQQGKGGVQLRDELRHTPGDAREPRAGDEGEGDGVRARPEVARDVRGGEPRADLDRGHQRGRGDRGQERVVRPAREGPVPLGAHEGHR